MSLGSLYQSFYDFLGGVHPNPRPWHVQWLPSRSIARTVEQALQTIEPEARVLDVGCGCSPYKKYLPGTCRYTGMDVSGGRGAPDILLAPDQAWPVEDESFDVVLCTEVLEHVLDPSLIFTETKRVLKKGGVLIVSVPFLYNEHGLPWDYRRYTAAGLSDRLSGDFMVETLVKHGKIGTVLGTLLLNWIDESCIRNRFLLYLRPLFLPVWLALCFGVNLLCRFADLMDKTEAFYLGTLVVAEKR